MYVCVYDVGREDVDSAWFSIVYLSPDPTDEPYTVVSSQNCHRNLSNKYLISNISGDTTF